MAIGLSHGGTTIYSNTTPSKQILVGTREGVVTIERDGAEWRIGQRALTDKHISAIIREPVSGLLFAGAFHGGVMVSADEGKSWEARNGGMSKTMSTRWRRKTSTAACACSPAPSRRIFSSAMTWVCNGASCPICARCRACPSGAFRRRPISAMSNISTSIPTIRTPSMPPSRSAVYYVVRMVASTGKNSRASTKTSTG